MIPVPALGFEAPPWRLSGVVVGALLNHAPAITALGAAAHEPPHKAPPRHPVLQVKPRNTLAGDGAAVVVPAGIEALEAGASLGIVIGRTACRVAEAQALQCVAGFTIAADLRVPHPGHYRPAVRDRARDGFCPVGPRVVAASKVPDPDRLAVRTLVDGVLAHATDTADRVRGVARLIADVSDFMTLQPGDLLLLGASHGAPRVRAGRTVAIEIEHLGALHLRLVAEEDVR